ncbi:hypothetical protein Pla175_01980 [Pirellulimonas nuda]|uniref:Uncharacterized protein n=1 Tax=Pirellulimonas nuda TaxID=2528009 RepID=A0A518D5U6_9BACT|nr:hypothetical protein [Pirellulimonas nuda]QDU86845.1 hypothetical protein Pla175_01980 [Pirellulimonas nuda]
MPTRLPRISLQTLLLLVTITAMALVIWQLSSKLLPLRREVQALRDETGQLTVDDPTKIHAIAMATDYPLAWKWRVWVPAGKRVRLAHSTHQVSKEGLPQSNGGLDLAGPQEFVVTVKLDRQPDGKWRSGLSYDGVTTFLRVPDDADAWLSEGSSGSQSRHVSRRGVTVGKPGEPMVLLRKRVFYGRGSIPPPTEPPLTDGLLVWIAEEGPEADPSGPQGAGP